MAHLFVHGEVEIDLPGGGHTPVLQLLGVGQQNGCTELVIQKPALDVAGLRHYGTGIKANHIPLADAQSSRVLGGLHRLINDNLHTLEFPSLAGVIRVHMDGGVIKLQASGVHSVKAGIDPAVLSLAVLRLQAAHRGKHQPSVSLDGLDHSPQGIHMGHEQQAPAFPAQADGDAALAGLLGSVSQPGKLLH